MGIRILRESASGSRTAGMAVLAGESIVPGIVIVQDDNTTVKVFTGTALAPLGLALDSNVQFPSQATAPDVTAGAGFDYLNYNRQGLVAAITGDAEVELYDDLRDTSTAGASHPVDHTQAYVVGAPLFADTTTGRVTSVVGSNKAIGRCTGIDGSGATMVVRMIVNII